MFLLALLPGICEEMLFRGAVLGLLRKGMPAGWAVWVQAALFSLAHLYGFRLLPTFGVGLATGWLVLRTGSLLPAVLLHTLHNALAVSQGSELALDLGDPSTVGALVGMVLVGLLALVLAGRGEGRS